MNNDRVSAKHNDYVDAVSIPTVPRNLHLIKTQSVFQSAIQSVVFVMIYALFSPFRHGQCIPTQNGISNGNRGSQNAQNV